MRHIFCTPSPPRRSPPPINRGRAPSGLYPIRTITPQGISPFSFFLSPFPLLAHIQRYSYLCILWGGIPQSDYANLLSLSNNQPHDKENHFGTRCLGIVSAYGGAGEGGALVAQASTGGGDTRSGIRVERCGQHQLCRWRGSV